MAISVKTLKVIDQFSAACWYFAQALTDRMVAEAEADMLAAAAGDVDAVATAPVPLGMIESAYGGTTIEQWITVPEQLGCSNITCLSNNSLSPTTPASMGKECTACAPSAKTCAYGNGGLYRGMVAPFINMYGVVFLGVSTVATRGWHWFPCMFG
jgi:hypothetical protein